MFKDVARFIKGYISTKRILDADNDYAYLGSENVLFVGLGRGEPFKGLNDTGQVGGIFGMPVTNGVGGLQPAITTLTVESNPTGVAVTVSPADLEGNSNGTG
jgi:hypothetical protein